MVKAHQCHRPVAGNVKKRPANTAVFVHAVAADPRLPVNSAPDTVNAHPATERVMSKGDKSSYSDKQKRQASHIEKSEKKEGKSEKTAERIAWATVNKQDGGGKKS
jgi:hypothetical protein